MSATHYMMEQRTGGGVHPPFYELCRTGDGNAWTTREKFEVTCEACLKKMLAMGLIEEVHISEIKAGDVIRWNGKSSTVCVKDIKRNTFTGISIFGDSYHSGRKAVLRVLRAR